MSDPLLCYMYFQLVFHNINSISLQFNLPFSLVNFVFHFNSFITVGAIQGAGLRFLENSQEKRAIGGDCLRMIFVLTLCAVAEKCYPLRRCFEHQ